MGEDGKLEPEEIIREHAFDISIAIFQYVSKAIVHADVATVTVGVSPSGPTTGVGTGTGAGKLG